jgi:FG-GAP-like repeat
MAKKIASSLALSCFIALTAAAQEPAQKTTPGNGPYGVPQATFIAHRLGTDHAEGISAMDMNGDGYLDLLSGAYWYENPGPQGGAWKQHQFRSVGTLGEFVSDCGEWAIDVNHDGAPDVVTAGWMTNGLFWYENPKKPDTMWERHFITDSFDTEGGWSADINGDGKPDIVLAHYNHSGILWVDFSGPQPKVHHVGGKEQDGHGTGVADINGDGKPDILTPTGWLENIDADHDQWKWHPDWDLGETGFPIIGYDVNNDGKMDLIYGRGHSYGIYWMEQQGSGDNRKWVQHIVDESFSQVHALKLVDIDGDGEPELIAGKRYRGHNGNDPGSYDPLVIYYYKIDRKTGQFTRYAVSVNGTAGAGTQFVTEDLDKDGDIDIAVAGKTGVHFLENLRIDKVPKEQREREILINKDWPFPNEGQVVQQENGPKQ